jgi:hypothetical protein
MASLCYVTTDAAAYKKMLVIGPNTNLRNAPKPLISHLPRGHHDAKEGYLSQCRVPDIQSITFCKENLFC